MAEQSFEEKTEKATPKKREEARKKGQVAKSRELPSVSVLLSSLITLMLFGSFMYSQIQIVTNEAFSLFSLRELNLATFTIFSQKMIVLFIIMTIPLFLINFITAVASNLIQVGFMFSGELIRPKLSKIDPIKGFGRLFSKQALMELLKSLLKLAIVGGVAYFTIRGEMRNVYLLDGMEFPSIVIYIFLTIFKIAIRCTLAMILLVVIDYAFQKWEFEKGIKMSKKEVKDEHKRTEGDPLVKQRIRSIQREMARRRMMQKVPEADVVITNPTSIAVALKYDASSMSAPKVLAKGAGTIATKIRELAAEHGIPIVENKELARSLYSSVQLDQEIPQAFYHAVAEILAYVYRLKRRYTNNVV